MIDLDQDLSKLVSSILVDAYDDYEQVYAFDAVFMDGRLSLDVS